MTDSRCDVCGLLPEDHTFPHTADEVAEAIQAGTAVDDGWAAEDEHLTVIRSVFTDFARNGSDEMIRLMLQCVATSCSDATITALFDDFIEVGILKQKQS